MKIFFYDHLRNKNLIMNDNYSHIENGIFYIVENIIGPVEQTSEYEQLLINFNSALSHNCNCGTSCTQTSCPCIQSPCSNYTEQYGSDGSLKHKINKERGLYPILECNDNCTCSENCGNRVVQKGPIDGLEIRSCNEKAKGLGLFSTKLIPEGTFVCEYAGELITKSQACKRHNVNTQNRKMNYIFCLNEHSGGETLQTFVDPSSFGNIGRYINHSCEPNCQIVPVRYQSPIPKLAIFSCMDIFPDMEITFNYGTSGNSGCVNCNRIKCLCNSKYCSGFMPYDKY